MPLDIFIYEYRVGDINQSVSDENQCKRISHVETVLNRMLDLYGELPESAGKKYAAMKIQANVRMGAQYIMESATKEEDF